MAGTTKGGQRVRIAAIERHGSLKAFKAHMAEIGRKGGKLSKRHLTYEEAAALGRMGKGTKKPRKQ